MNGQVTDYVAGNWLKDFTPAWFSLHVADPGRAGNIHSEVVGGSYKRLSGAFTPYDARTIWLNVVLTWTGLPAVLITHVGIWDKSINGHLLSSAQLPPPFPDVKQGGSFSLAAKTYAISIGLPG